jgi:ABC-2 type transport system ATP-binding protein
VIELKGVTKTYGPFRAVDNVSLSVRPSEILGYLGPNGAGKTTTIKMLMGFFPPSRGEILYNGRNIKKTLYEYRTKLGYVPEEAAAYPYLSALDYLLLVGRLRRIPEKPLRSRLERFLELFDLKIAMDSPLSDYSKGMVQKVILASALLHDPDILILDEPLSGLDVETAMVIKNVLQKLSREGKTIFFSSHVLEVVEKICSRVIIIHQGRIVADDSVENLRELMQLPSLGEIFKQLVIQKDTEKTADEVVKAMKAGFGA